MQKVVGSSPISHLREARSWSGFRFLRGSRTVPRNRDEATGLWPSRADDSVTFANRGQRLALEDAARLLCENDVLAPLADAERIGCGFAGLVVASRRGQHTRE